MRALALSTAWILGGLAVAGALAWAFLNTPESTVFTLSLSLVLVLAICAVLGITVGGAVLGWLRGWTAASLRRAPAGGLAALPPLVFVALVWWLVGRLMEWTTAHAGEISAWSIARLDWSDAQPLLVGISWTGDWVRTIAAPFAALVWLAHVLARGWRPIADSACLRRACAPLPLALATLVCAATIRLPLAYGLSWMPRGLPPTWVEPAVAVLKLAALAVLGAAGLSTIVRLAVRGTPPAS
jgi:hypothetical protein